MAPSVSHGRSELNQRIDSNRRDQAQVARDQRLRLVVAERELENALAAASWHRTQAWTRRVQDALTVLQTALRDSRDSADAPGSLLSDVLAEEPRLESRVAQLRADYERLEQRTAALLTELAELGDLGPSPAAVEDARLRLRELTFGLQQAQAQETEVLYEAFNVDVGTGD